MADLDMETVHYALSHRFDDARRLTETELVAAMYEELGIDYDPKELHDRAKGVRSDDLRAWITAMWLADERGEMHEDAKAEMEYLIDAFAANGK